MAPTQVAIITGGASGMGLEAAKALAKRGDWSLHLLDMNAERGKQAASSLPNATFHKVNILDYKAFSHIFDSVFNKEGRLDFVFANAGIVERFNFYEIHPAGGPPPELDQTVIDINLKSVTSTSWLAQHYFRQSKESSNKNLIMTASCGGLYRCQVSPCYCAAKHGVVGLMRSIAPHMFKHHSIRVNAILPGTVKTNLLDPTAWSTFKDEWFVPIEKIAEVITMLIDGDDVGGKAVGGKEVNGSLKNNAEKLWGKAVEISGTNHYYREQVEFSDQHMKECMVACERETYVE